MLCALPITPMGISSILRFFSSLNRFFLRTRQLMPGCPSWALLPVSENERAGTIAVRAISELRSAHSDRVGQLSRPCSVCLLSLRWEISNKSVVIAFDGKGVGLTFLYTHCPDYSPLRAELLRHADEAAGHPAGVVYVAVSVDPTGDTRDSIAAFERQHHMDELGDRWHYLIGDPGELSGVRRSYYVGVSPGPASNKMDHPSANDIARNALMLAKE